MKKFILTVIATTLLALPVVQAADVPSEPAVSCRTGLVWQWAKRHRLRTLGIGFLAAGLAYGSVEQLAKQSETAATAAFSSPDGVGPKVDVAVYGDSLCQATNGYCGVLPGIWETRTQRGGWPNDLSSDATSAVSLFERLREEQGEQFPLRIWNGGRSGAYIDPAKNQSGFVKRNLFLARDLSEQVKASLARPDFANVHMISLGVNNLDYAFDIEEYKLDREKYIKELPDSVAAALESQLDLIVARALLGSRKTEIVVYGLPHLESVVAMRNKALESPANFPHASAIDKSFPSFKKDNQKTLVELGLRTNAAFEKLVAKYQERLSGSGVRVRYSDAISRLEFKTTNDLSTDALHPANSAKSKISFVVLQDWRDAKTLQWIGRKP